MKFLCVPCDTPMRLTSTGESEPGSLSVVYACPACGYEMAMLTNAQETQMVRSLGVRIGPAAAQAVAAPEAVDSAASGAGTAKCPFSAMLGGTDAGDVAESTAAEAGPAWTPEALARLEAIPEMVRPMARAGVEMVAREQGHRVIDEAVLAAARARFGM
jgi:predicted RNA-binding Zn-ribbon protein involved in translation (DUF1610 family)